MGAIMNRGNLCLIGMMFLLVGSRVFAEEVEIPVETLLAPSHGFEEKNNIQVVLYGVLPNACYTLGGNKTDMDLVKKTVLVHQYATRDRSGICAEDSSLPLHMSMVIPFTAEVSVGHLGVGDFSFQFEKPRGEKGIRALNVAPNVTLTVDSLPYAVVSGMSVPDIVNGIDEVRVNVEGVLTSTCTDLDDEVKVLKESDVFVLLPTVRVKHNVLCTQALVPFRKEVNLGRAMPGRYLIHTRSMNGKSVNRLVEVGR